MAEIGYGMQLWVAADTTATTATVKLAEITNITPPALEASEVEVTHTDSPNAIRQFIPGLSDPGSLEVEMNWTPESATDQLIRDMMFGRETRYMEIRFTQLDPAVTFAGRGFFMTYTPGAPLDDRMTAAAAVRAAGVWDYV